MVISSTPPQYVDVVLSDDRDTSSVSSLTVVETDSAFLFLITTDADGNVREDVVTMDAVSVESLTVAADAGTDATRDASDADMMMAVMPRPVTTGGCLSAAWRA